MTAKATRQMLHPKDVLLAEEWATITKWLNGREFEVVRFSYSTTDPSITAESWEIGGVIDGGECEIRYDAFHNPRNEILFTVKNYA